MAPAAGTSEDFFAPQIVSDQEDLSSKVANLATFTQGKKLAQTVIFGVCTFKMAPCGTTSIFPVFAAFLSGSAFLIPLVNMTEVPLVTVSKNFRSSQR